MTDLVPVSQMDPFALAERVSKSNLIPQAYRGKAADVAICMMYGAEVGLPPMTALQRIIVINGKPTLDSQGMAALIRGAGHSIVGKTSNESAEVIGKRADNGDTMTVTFTIEDAKRAGLVKNGPWTQYPSSMLWARAVSKLARELFPDVLMGMSYVPEEMGEVVGEIVEVSPAQVAQEAVAEMIAPLPPLIDATTGEILDPDDEPVDGEVVTVADEFDPPPVQSAPNDIGEVVVRELPSTVTELKVVLNEVMNSVGDKAALKAHLLTKFGPIVNRTVAQLQESVTVAAGWPESAA